MDPSPIDIRQLLGSTRTCNCGVCERCTKPSGTTGALALRVSSQYLEAENVDVASQSALELSQPHCLSLRMKPPKLQTKSVMFAATGIQRLPANPPAAATGSATATKAAESKANTQSSNQSSNQSSRSTANRDAKPSNDDQESPDKPRLQPPKDLVKLEDRWFYVLQPPLETLLKSESLTFPFEPFPYQYAGIAFLYSRTEAILADEMGLGKTMQAISSIRLLLRTGEARRVLLVCPKPLVTNWQKEFAVWAPEIPVAVVAGDQNKRAFAWRQPSPVTLANYEVLIRDYESAYAEDFDVVVLDEAQRVKNRNSNTSQIVRGVPRKRSWALTGTPVENSREDLVGIFEFLSPGSITESMSPKKMGEASRDFILRRVKDNVLKDLPPRLDRDADLGLTPEQQASYERAEKEGVLHLGELGDEITIQHVFELVLRLKQICNFDPLTGASSKLDQLQADLQEVAASGAKAIVFSQWVDTIEQLDRHLGDYHPLQFHGRIPSKKRDAILDQFKHDEKHRVLMMSYGAGSVGLNLQFCRYVFLYDRWWNPAVEDQAINRAHRIGSAGSVTVTRFTTIGTIEERIAQILNEKRQLFETILSEADSSMQLSLSQSEIFGLFGLNSPRRKRAA